eukprot:CAMPEP_0206141576 /NCGR_PEP_ID=MMETSP1473-20131121/13432_1 /ASSEMBLY_ACC=CAM_ASM_001109 /TAXON_ID=1461547 /ORGANISM="Stichococcus sp, Strain RCC1054" /LENGTH=31 /DNA_ID= /DNA_START= /DNA_END= /DNA_ORIENTATION=
MTLLLYAAITDLLCNLDSDAAIAACCGVVLD